MLNILCEDARPASVSLNPEVDMRSGAEIMEEMMAAPSSPKKNQQQNPFNNNQGDIMSTETKEKVERTAEEQKSRDAQIKRIVARLDSERASLDEAVQVKMAHRLEKISGKNNEANAKASAKVFEDIIDGKIITDSKLDDAYEDALAKEESSSH